MNTFYNITQNCIQDIKAIDLTQLNSFTRVDHAFRKFPGIRHFKVTFLKGSRVYRCRPNGDVSLFTHTGEIQHPPAATIGHFGRCNKPGQSVFYASEFEWNSFIELMHSLDKKVAVGANAPVTVGQWVLQEDLAMVVVLNPANKDSMARYMAIFENDFNFVINQEPPEEIEGLRLFFHFIADVYATSAINNENIYKLTSAYSNLVFDTKETHGIIYPSVQYHHSGISYAFKPSVIEEKKIILESAAKFIYLKGQQDNGKASFTQLPPGAITANKIDTPTGKIIWQ